MERVLNIDAMKVEGDWMPFWKLKVPLKVKAFLWKVCRDCIPTRIRLHSKGINWPGTCVLCNSQLENRCHVFLTCDSSIQCCRREQK